MQLDASYHTKDANCSVKSAILCVQRSSVFKLIVGRLVYKFNCHKDVSSHCVRRRPKCMATPFCAMLSNSALSNLPLGSIIPHQSADTPSNNKE